MIFVVEHKVNGEVKIDVVHGEELDTDAYDHVEKIFFCETEVEAQAVVAEIRNWGSE